MLYCDQGSGINEKFSSVLTLRFAVYPAMNCWAIFGLPFGAGVDRSSLRGRDGLGTAGETLALRWFVLRTTSEKTISKIFLASGW